MKDQKPDKEQSKQQQRTDQQLANPGKESKDLKSVDHEKKSEGLRSSENPNQRASNNDTLGIP